MFEYRGRSEPDALTLRTDPSAVDMLLTGGLATAVADDDLEERVPFPAAPGAFGLMADARRRDDEEEEQEESEEEAGDEEEFDEEEELDEDFDEEEFEEEDDDFDDDFDEEEEDV